MIIFFWLIMLGCFGGGGSVFICGVCMVGVGGGMVGGGGMVLGIGCVLVGLGGGVLVGLISMVLIGWFGSFSGLV